ncbi:hypothetical protein PFICI_05732 [Pestalotiopsis fici W106-1]|uniref:Uncharacterized protein n=1 Tax=Pestalotiopsis fici (strain W106-1 / CGMCC3.15140) TaxID=1229662 RepID=W3XF83_PESFW|nr:uncharacterized protein PFICI_05732 [Pestalotiopsis fici W106-1]ETS83856.1 hypothetical protein PFICI_05732 [Pestalotiopsis fici W106-1]
MVGGPFALPLPVWRQATSAQRADSRKRKRREGTLPEDNSSQDDEPLTPSALPSDSINPRSHSPDTLRQFAVAGLSPDEEVPSKLYPRFPHRSLPSGWQTGEVPRRRRSRSRTSGVTSESEAEGAETDGETVRRLTKNGRGELMSSHADIFKHMSTLMAILHRCIHEGDMRRAKRAFGLLLGTRHVDVRLNDMWTLGTEILMRDGETNKRQQARSSEASTDHSHTDGDGPDAANGDARPPPPARWGSADNMQKVRDYIETLAQHHPYDVHFTRSVSAVDFWPALYNIEIYNVDAEHRRALHRLEDSAALEDEDDGNDEFDMPYDDQYPDGDGDGDYEARLERRSQQREAVRARKQCAARDEIQNETRVAAQQIAERMDNLMMAVPYTTHVELLRLRGMLSLFIGDLQLPTRLLHRCNLIGYTTSELRLTTLKERVRNQVQSQEDWEAVWRWESEVDKAKLQFEKLAEKGIRLEPWLAKYLEPDEDVDTSR